VAAVLVTLAEFETFLGGTVAAESTLRQALLDDVEAMFVAECGRQHAPFSAALTNRTEKQKATGSPTLVLDYPVADLDAVVLGFNSGSPDETLDPDDTDELIWEVGKHTVTRVDGGRFGRFGDPAYCHVTYDTVADLPDDASLAVKRVAAAVYRQRGSEDASSETIGGQAVSLASVAASDPVWVAAVANHRRSAF
jgi:hypothetical protein